MSFLSSYQQSLRELGQLPAPDADACAVSQALSQHLGQMLQQAPLSFAEFMHQALYAPGLGYYSAGSTKLGPAGDFITAPELSPLFGQTIARQIRPLLAALPADSWLIEVGAGSGALAESLLHALQRENALPSVYAILEVSADLRERQQQRLKTSLPDYYSQIRWLDQLPETAISALVIANEVLDAMPVEIWRQQSQLQQAYVRQQQDQFELYWQPASPALQQWFAGLESREFEPGYQSEASLLLPGWLQAWSQSLKQGALLLIDYGFDRTEYYHPQRHQGTLMCHYRHRAHDNPLLLVGLQDITAHVDFSYLADSASDCGFQVCAYSTQADFLLSGGLLDALSELSAEQQYRATAAVKMLTLPQEMGELFKVMLLTKGLEFEASHFCSRDLRHKL